MVTPAVRPNDDGSRFRWKVTQLGETVSRHETKQNAIDKAKRVAREEMTGTVRLFNSEGRLQGGLSV